MIERLLGSAAFCADLFWYPFHPPPPPPPHVTAVAHKRSWSFCPNCKWQVTANHTCTLQGFFWGRGGGGGGGADRATKVNDQSAFEKTMLCIVVCEFG